MASYSSARVGDVRRESRATIPGKEETKDFRILGLERSIRKENIYLWMILDCLVRICSRTATL